MAKKKEPKDSKQVEELKNQLARALADYDNLEKRLKKDEAVFKKFMIAKVAARFLPVLDMLEDTQKHLTDGGLAIAIKEFESVLRDEDVEAIKADPGTDFNEEVHEAVEVVKGENGKIVEELAKGYKMIDGPVIRVAKVKVGKKDE